MINDDKFSSFLNEILEEQESDKLKDLKSVAGAIEIINITLEEGEELMPTCIAIGETGNVAFPVPLFDETINSVIYKVVAMSKDKLEDDIGELQEFCFIAESHTPFKEQYLNETATKWFNETGSFNGCPVPLQDLITICFGTKKEVGLLSLEIVEFEGKRLIVTKDMTSDRHPCRFSISSWEEENHLKGRQPDALKQLLIGGGGEKSEKVVLET